MRLSQAGFPNTVAFLGTRIFEHRMAWLSQAPAILLLLDGDHAGRDASSLIAHSMQPLTTVYTHYLPDGKEPEDLSDQSLTCLLACRLSCFLLNQCFFER